MITHRGGCHCGRVRFEVDAPAEILVDDCNCSMCSRFGYLHLIVPADRFRLVQGQDALTTYTFNTGTAKHYFCSICGIYTFHQRRSNNGQYGVNVACLKGMSPFDFAEVPVLDGVNHPADGGRKAGAQVGVLRYVAVDS